MDDGEKDDKDKDGGERRATRSTNPCQDLSPIKCGWEVFTCSRKMDSAGISADVRKLSNSAINSHGSSRVVPVI